MSEPANDSAEIQTGVEYALEPAVAWSALARRTFIWIGIGTAAFVVAATSDSGLGVWLRGNAGELAWALPLAALHVAFPLLSFRYWRWSLREHDFRVRYGVFTRREVSIPLSRIQQVDSASGVLDRWLGITQLQIHSAGSRAARVDLPGVSSSVSEPLQARLTELGDRLAR